MKKLPVQNEIVDIVSQIVTKYHPERIILFGSALSGQISKDSDIDIMIIKRDVPERGIDRQLEVDKLIEREDFALDMIVYRQEEIEEALKLGDPFLKNIMATGKVLYG